MGLSLVIHLQKPYAPVIPPHSLSPHTTSCLTFFLAISSLITHDNSWANVVRWRHFIQSDSCSKKKRFLEILLGSQSENALFICHYSKGECFFSPWDLLQKIWFNDVSGLFRDISSLVGMLDGRLTCQRKGTTIIVYVRFWPLICYLSTRFSFFLVHSNFVCTVNI